MADAENAERQAEELLVLQSIYEAGTIEIISDHALHVHLAGPRRLTLQLTLPLDYPSASAPIVVIDSPGIAADDVSLLAKGIDQLYQPGEEVLFNYIEYVRETWIDLCPPPPEERNPAGMEGGDAKLAANLHELALNAKDSAADVAEQLEMASLGENIVHGEPFTVQKSTFQAHLCPCRTVEQVKLVMDILLLNNKIRAASHNMMAFRIERPDKPGTWIQDCDDDGESAAGGRLLHLLELVGARNVVVVVSRWFGGVLLGPARFGHINNTARQLLVECGYVVEKEKAVKGGGKKAG